MRFIGKIINNLIMTKEIADKSIFYQNLQRGIITEIKFIKDKDSVGVKVAKKVIKQKIR